VAASRWRKGRRKRGGECSDGPSAGWRRKKKRSLKGGEEGREFLFIFLLTVGGMAQEGVREKKEGGGRGDTYLFLHPYSRERKRGPGGRKEREKGGGREFYLRNQKGKGFDVFLSKR